MILKPMRVPSIMISEQLLARIHFFCFGERIAELFPAVLAGDSSILPIICNDFNLMLKNMCQRLFMS